MDKFYVEFSIERDSDRERVDTWTVYLRRKGQVSLEICTCLEEVKANVVAKALEIAGMDTIFDIVK